jgi:hypothetical protein
MQHRPCQTRSERKCYAQLRITLIRPSSALVQSGGVGACDGLSRLGLTPGAVLEAAHNRDAHRCPIGSEDKEQLMTVRDRWTVEAAVAAFDEHLRRARERTPRRSAARHHL